MSRRKGLVLDANILLRAVFGRRVLSLIEAHEDAVDFFSPEACFAEAEAYLPAIAMRRGLELDIARTALAGLIRVVTPVTAALYEPMQGAALTRIGERDARDWPVIALALVLAVPIWTEDRDFFGVGIPVWTTAKVELYLTGSE